MNKLRDEMRRRKRQALPMDMSPAAGSNDQSPSQWAQVQQQVVAGGPSPGEQPIEQLAKAEQIEQLQQAVTQLSEADQEVLYLRHTAGLSFAQIAQTLELPLGTVLARGHRALKKLTRLMKANTADAL